MTGKDGGEGGRSRASRQLLPALPYLPTSLWVAALRDAQGRASAATGRTPIAAGIRTSLYSRITPGIPPFALRAAASRRSNSLPANLVSPFGFESAFITFLSRGPESPLDRKMAEREGFEPPWGLRPHLISSQRRYDRFGTSPGAQKLTRVRRVKQRTAGNSP